LPPIFRYFCGSVSPLFFSPFLSLSSSTSPMPAPVPSSPSTVSDGSRRSSFSAAVHPTSPSATVDGYYDTLLTSETSNISPIGGCPSSWKPKFELHLPPEVTRPYNPEEALGDIQGVSYALETFLSSHMLESEEYCHKMDEPK
jgi:hypothetical protein